MDRASRITWLVDGEIIARGAGIKRAQFKTGKLGSRSKIDVVIESAESGAIQESIVITPTEVNLLWEASSYTPPFYSGKALPASDAEVTVIAMPEFIASSGKKLSAKDLIFIWEKDGKVLGNLSGRGKDTLKTIGPKISRTSRVDVKVSSADGTLQGKGVTFISAISPKIVFYEYNNIFGVRYEEAISNEFSLLNEEVKITAYPYFFSSNTKVVPSSNYKWMIDGSLVESALDDSSSIILRQVGEGEGSAGISLSIENADKILQFAKKKFTMFFGVGGSSETLFTF